MDDLLGQMQEVFVTIVTNLFNPEAWKEIFKRPGIMLAAFIVLNLIVFTETGLLVGFFLPGDSLLVTAGIVTRLTDGAWPLGWLLATLCFSAIAGDSVGYAIGRRMGPGIFRKEKSRFFAKDHLLAAQAFYDKRGGLTVILARFMPFIRTFAPVVAGVAKMNYKRFLFYNVIGGIGWVFSMILLGYYLPTVIDPLLRPVLGENFRIEKHIDKVILVVIFVSVAPLAIGALRAWRQKPTTSPIEP